VNILKQHIENVLQVNNIKAKVVIKKNRIDVKSIRDFGKVKQLFPSFHITYGFYK